MEFFLNCDSFVKYDFIFYRSLFWRLEISNLWMMSKSSIVLWKWEVPNWQPIRLKQVVQCGILKEISIPKALFQLLRLKSSLIFLTRNLWSQSFTSLRANLCQNINGGFAFSKCLKNEIPSSTFCIMTPVKWTNYVYVLTEICHQ